MRAAPLLRQPRHLALPLGRRSLLLFHAPPHARRRPRRRPQRQNPRLLSILKPNPSFWLPWFSLHFGLDQIRPSTNAMKLRFTSL